MKEYQVPENEHFVGRSYEKNQLEEIYAQQGSKILIVYGRRRVGKTELLEQTFRKRQLVKFEGRENTTEPEQMHFVMKQLAAYTEEPLLVRITVSDWIDVLKEIALRVKEGAWTVYFEEVQWLACYKPDFVTALKYVWDNFFRHNKELLLILCGSSPSFMIQSVIKSKALYNRSQYALPLSELHLLEAQELLSGFSIHEVLDAYLTVGGLPEYLKRLHEKKSVYMSLCRESFLPGSFFAFEYERIFTSSLATNKHYKEIIAFLSQKRFATRNEIMSHLKLQSGGSLTQELLDLQVCGFIDAYTPYHLSQKSHLVRYCITDAYMQFYFRFIEPKLAEIERGNFRSDPMQALNMNMYQQFLGYAFERFCRKFHCQIATLLGFHGVKYRVGTYFSKKTEQEKPGFQIDLLFDRDDKVLTVCELKYLQTPVTTKVIDELEKKLQALPNGEKKTIQKVLISNRGPDAALQRRAYFDVTIQIEDLFTPFIWR